MLRTWSGAVWWEGWRLADGCSATSDGREGDLVGHARVLSCRMLRGHPQDRTRSLGPLTRRVSARGFGAVLSRSCLQTCLLPAQLPPMQSSSPRRVCTLGDHPAFPAPPGKKPRCCGALSNSGENPSWTSTGQTVFFAGESQRWGAMRPMDTPPPLLTPILQPPHPTGSRGDAGFPLLGRTIL